MGSPVDPIRPPSGPLTDHHIMTNLFTPRLRARALSAPVGSGKTRAAIAWIANPLNASRNVIYVAPTTALVDQTAAGLREAIAGTSGDTFRNVNLIHAGNAEGQVQVEALAALNGVEDHEGHVQLLTTPTFLVIVSRIKRPELWSVVLDEAFTPATFATFRLGADALRGWEHFCELFAVDGPQGHRILPREGCRTVVEEVARSNYSTAGDRFKSLEDVARAVSNPAIRCELVLTDGALSLFKGEAPKKRKARKDADTDITGTVLQFSSYVDPSAFAGFREVLFLAALFEQTVLYNLWTRALGVTFEEHREFPAEMLRDTHKEQGRFLAVGHLLHKDDPASLDNLTRETLTGQPGATRPGTRVIDYLVQTAAGHFGEDRFLLQTNERFGYRKDAASVPRNAVVIPAFSHGLNTFSNVDNVVALAVTNPNPQQLAWVRSRTGMTAKEVTQSYRIHACYQALGRCSIRKAVPTTTAKVVLTVGSDDAKFIHDLFPGSHWLGQVGTLPSLQGLQRSETKEPGKTETLALAIVRKLQTIDPCINKVSSRKLKGLMEIESLHLHLIALGVVEDFGGIESTLWTRALSQACVIGSGWQKQGGSLFRVNAALYGFADHGMAPRPSMPLAVA